MRAEVGSAFCTTRTYLWPILVHSHYNTYSHQNIRLVGVNCLAEYGIILYTSASLLSLKHFILMTGDRKCCRAFAQQWFWMESCDRPSAFCEGTAYSRAKDYFHSISNQPFLRILAIQCITINPIRTTIEYKELIYWSHCIPKHHSLNYSTVTFALQKLLQSNVEDCLKRTFSPSIWKRKSESRNFQKSCWET